MNGEESTLLRRIEDKVDGMAEACSAIPFIRENMSAFVEYQKEQDERITAVERDALIARGGMIVVAFLMVMAASVGSIIAAMNW